MTRSPRTLFNLGSAVVQPPTFAGDSGVGYAVTAGGDLVRFDLDNPARRRQRGLLRPAGAGRAGPRRAGKSWWPSPTASSISWARKATA